MSTDQTDHRAEAEQRLSGFGMRWTPTENLLAAINDEQRLHTGLLTDLRGALDDLAEVLRGPLIGERDPNDVDVAICEGCGRHLPCRHCPDDPKTATGDDLSAPQPSEAPADGEGTW